MVIRFFSQSETHREFSNFAPFGIDLDGAWWPTVENYYQAQKFTDADLRQSIRQAERPIIAKTLADENKAAIRPDWDAVKDDVMYRAVRRKFELHPALKAHAACDRRGGHCRSQSRPTAIGASAATERA